MFIAGFLSTNEEIQVHIPVVQHTNTLNLPTANDHVQVPRSTFMPCPIIINEMQQLLVNSSLLPDSSFDYELFKLLLATVGQHLLNNCQDCTV